MRPPSARKLSNVSGSSMNSARSALGRLFNLSCRDASDHAAGEEPGSEIRALNGRISPAALPAGFAAIATRSAAVAARRHRLGLVDFQAAPTVLMVIELADGATRTFGVAHFDECEPARLTRGPIANDADRAHLAGALEQRLQVRFCGFVRKVADVQFGTHELLLHLKGCDKSDG